MAKIGNLEVTKLKIAESAITSYGVGDFVATGTGGSSTLAVTNTYGMPTQVYITVICVYFSPSSDFGSVVATLTRNGVTVATEGITFGGFAGTYSAIIDWVYCDIDPSGTVTYVVSGSGGKGDPSLGSVSATPRPIYATWEKV